jgi:alpha-1,2-mannosyltransferase
MTPRRWTAAAWIAVTLPFALLNVLQWLSSIRRDDIYTDFGGYYALAWLGLHHGWSALYDLDLQRQAWSAIGPVTWYPNMYPPLVAWVAVPFTWLPFPAAYALWSLLIVALLVASWWLAAGGERLVKAAQVCAAVSLLPVGFGLRIGQVVFLDLAAVVACWFLLTRRKDVWAGLALTVIAIKPQVAFLVPLAILAHGRGRAFAAWAVATFVIGAFELLSVGPAAVQVYLVRVMTASAHPAVLGLQLDQSLPGLLGHGPGALGAQLAIVAAVGWIALRWRRSGIEVPIAAALIGSLLATPFLHVEDFTMLVPAAWLYLRARSGALDLLLLALGYVSCQLALGGGLPIVMFELAWLITLLLRQPPAADIAIAADRPLYSGAPAAKPVR